MTTYTNDYGVTLSGGANDLVTWPDSTALNLGAAGTICLWVKLHRGYTGTYNVIGQWTANTDNCWDVQIGSTGRIYFYIADSASDAANNAYITDAGMFPNDSLEHHVAVKFSAGTATVYVDGILCTGAVAGTLPATLRDSAAIWRIGSLGGSVSTGEGYACHPMDVTNVGVWNVALSGANILLDAQLSRPTTGLVAWFGRIQPSSTDWVDSIAANNATLVANSVGCCWPIESAQERILCIGDSTTMGAVGGATYSDLVGYRGLLAARLSSNPHYNDLISFVGNYGFGASFFNRHSGVSGEKVAGTAARVNAVIDTWKPTKILMLIGTNNTHDNTFVEADYLALCRQILARHGRHSLHFGSIPIGDKSYTVPANTYICTLEPVLRATYPGRAFYVPIEAGFPDSTGAGDTLHPNLAVGYPHIALRFHQSLQREAREVTGSRLFP